MLFYTKATLAPPIKLNMKNGKEERHIVKYYIHTLARHVKPLS